MTGSLWRNARTGDGDGLPQPSKLQANDVVESPPRDPETVERTISHCSSEAGMALL